MVFEDVDLTGALGLLRSGTNLLAVQGLNRELHGNDFLIDLELHAGQPQPITAADPRYFAQPSPGSPNGLVSFAGAIDDIMASTPRGFYEQPMDVAVRSSTPGATLVYTTDGSLPSLSHGTQVPPATAGEGPAVTLRVDRTTTLRVRASGTISFRRAQAPSPTCSSPTSQRRMRRRLSMRGFRQSGAPPIRTTEWTPT